MIRKKKFNEKGQVAIFVALIFQLLFLFFAMIINVGLLIHHKINLQNSVDLAAYYGAMKQGETLNAMGHINYQIRQSWKLLSWRYRQLGSAGNFTEAHPFEKRNIEICNRSDCSLEGVLPNRQFESFYNAPAFCITYVPFRPMPSQENTCKGSDSNRSIPTFEPPKIYAPFIGASSVLNSMAKAFLRSMDNRCQAFGPMNYIILGRFVAAFSKDQAEKKLMMRHLALGLSDSKTDFVDIDGESGKEGMIETLKRNMTGPNREGFNPTSDVEIFNALGSEDCNSSGIDVYSPPKFLSEVKIYPGFTYTDTKCENPSNGRSKIETKIRTFDDKDNNGLPFGADKNPQMADVIKYLKPFLSTYPPDRKSVV